MVAAGRAMGAREPDPAMRNPDIERVAVREDHVAEFARVERTEPVAEAEHLGHVEGDGLESFVIRQAIGHSKTC